jgi:hypothetical protein
MRFMLSLSMALTMLACGSVRRDGFADPASSPDAPPGDSVNGGYGALGDAATRDAACAGGQPANVAQDITIDPAFSDTYRAMRSPIVLSSRSISERSPACRSSSTAA